MKTRDFKQISSLKAGVVANVIKHRVKEVAKAWNMDKAPIMAEPTEPEDGTLEKVKGIYNYKLKNG